MPVGRQKSGERKTKRAPRFRLPKVDSRFLYLSNKSVDDIEFSQVVQNEKVDDTKVGKFIVQLKCVELFLLLKQLCFVLKFLQHHFLCNTFTTAVGKVGDRQDKKWNRNQNN